MSVHENQNPAIDLKVLHNKMVKDKLITFCRAGAAFTEEDTECSMFWHNLEKTASELNNEEIDLITGQQISSPIGKGNTPLHLLIELLEIE